MKLARRLRKTIKQGQQIQSHLGRERQQILEEKKQKGQYQIEKQHRESN